MILLVRHDAADDAKVHFLDSHEAAVDIVRAFGGDPRFLDDVPDTEPPASAP